MPTSVAYQRKACRKTAFRFCTLEYFSVLGLVSNIKFKVSGPQFSHKTIVDLKISTTKYPFVPSFISNETLWNFRVKFAKKKVILGTEFEKEILEFRISNPSYSYFSFILNIALWSFGNKVAQKRYFRDVIWENYCWNSKSAPLNTLVYTDSFYNIVCILELIHIEQIFINFLLEIC